MKRNVISTNRLAQICGVSQGTVDRALNNRKGINPETKEKILKAAKEYGYRPNIHARSIAGGKSMLIGVVVFDLNNQYFSEILTQIEMRCKVCGYSTVVMFSHKDKQAERECIENLYSMSVDGIVLCPINQGEEFEKFLLSLEIPVVTIGNRLEQIPYIGIDNYAAMRDVVRCAVEKGYQKLIYVYPNLDENENAYAQTERLRAFKEMTAEYGIDQSVINITHAAQQSTAEKKSAFICTSDIYALKLMSAAQQRGLGIIGFDNLWLIETLDIQLDSVAYDVEKAAQSVVDFLIGQKEDFGIIKHEIVRRGSL